MGQHHHYHHKKKHCDAKYKFQDQMFERPNAVRTASELYGNYLTSDYRGGKFRNVKSAGELSPGCYKDTCNCQNYNKQIKVHGQEWHDYDCMHFKDRVCILNEKKLLHQMKKNKANYAEPFIVGGVGKLD